MNVPANPEMELAALAACIGDGGKGRSQLDLDLFTHGDAALILGGIDNLRDRGVPVAMDTLVLSGVFNGRNDLLSDLSRNDGGSLAWSLDILAEKRALREVQAAARMLLADVAELDAQRLPGPGPILEAIAATSQSLRGIGRKLTPAEGRGAAQDVLRQVIDTLEASDRGEKPPMVPTGIPGLDWALGGGLRGNEVTVVGARTSVGKSAFACWIAVQAAQAGKRVLYASREMPAKDIMARLASILSRVPVRLSEGTKSWNTQQERAVLDAAALMKTWPVVIRDDLKAIAQVSALVENEPPDLLVVDHVGIMDSGLGPKASSFDKATKTSHDLRDLALDSKGMAVLALVQVNRTGADQDAPRLHDLKGTGALEEDAGAVLLLHREEEVSSREQVLGLNVPKNRHGPVKSLRLRFETEVFRFTEQRPMPDRNVR